MRLQFGFLLALTILSLPVTSSAKEYRFACSEGFKAVGNLFVNTSSQTARWAYFPQARFKWYANRYITWSADAPKLQGSTKTATIDVTNGEVNCTGYSDKGKFSTNMTKNKVRHTFIINCDDGRTGAAQVTVNARSEGFGLSANGVGIGSLSDGSKVRLVIGEMSGSLAW